jgi:putative ABC transport system substrate-binding protein
MISPRAIFASLALLLGAAHAVHAQQAAKVHRVGVLVFAEPVSPEGPAMRSVWRGLREFGYAKGKNIEVVVRSAENRAERLPALVAELLAQKVDVLLAGSTPGALAAKKATRTVPIVFAGVLDPVGSGIVPSLARPGGNITGVTVGIGGEGFTAKCLEVLRETVPRLSRVAVLVNPGYPLSRQFRKEVQEVEKTLNMKFEVHEASSAEHLERALAAIGASQAQGIFVTPDPFLTASSGRIAQFAASSRLPSLHYSERFAEAGGLVSYGGSLDESYRRAAAYVHRILRGANPADLPVEQPTRFQLVVNLKTAKAIGLRIPQSILSRADRTID